MKKSLLVAAAASILSLVTADYAFAKGWCGGGAKGGARSAASSARTKIDWTRGNAPGTGAKSETADYFASIVQVQKAKHRGEMSILYLFDSSDAKLKKFEDTLFKNEQVGIGMKLFNRIQVDVSKDSVAKEMAGNKLPQFIVFNAKGQRTADVTLKGYKASPSGLLRAMAKGAKGHSKLSFNAFVKKYRSLLNDIDKLEKQKEVHADKMTRAGESKSKMKKLQKKADEMAKTQKDLTEREGEMLRGAGAVGHTKAPAPVAKK